MSDFTMTSLVVIWVFLALSAIVISLRLLARFKIAKSSGSDDALIVFSWCINLATSIAYTISASKGTGKHASTLTPAQLSEAVRLELITNAILDHTFAWPKLSIALLLIRLFVPRSWIKVHLLALPCILIVFSFLLSVFNFVQCDPVSGNWNKEIPANCWNPNIFRDFAIFVGCFSAAIDLYFVIYPIANLWNLQMEQRKKIGVSLSMSLGIVAFAACIVKTVQLSRLESHNDLPYSFAQIDTWNQIEANIIMIAASLPTLGPLLRVFRGKRSSAGANQTSTGPSFHSRFATKPSDALKEKSNVNDPDSDAIQLVSVSGRPAQSQEDVDIAEVENGTGIARQVDVTLMEEDARLREPLPSAHLPQTSTTVPSFVFKSPESYEQLP